MCSMLSEGNDRMRFLTFLLFAFFPLGGCTGSPYLYRLMIPQSLDAPDSAAHSDTLFLNLEGILPDPCYKMDRYEFKRKGDTLSIFPWIKREKDLPCVQVIVAFRDTLSYLPKKSGLHFFRVEGIDTVLLDSTWILPEGP